MSRLTPGTTIAGAAGAALAVLLTGCASSPTTDQANAQAAAAEPETTVAHADTGVGDTTSTTEWTAEPEQQTALGDDRTDEATTPQLEIRRASRKPVDGWEEMPVYRDDRQRRRWIAPDAVLTGEHVASATLVDDEDRRGVRIRLTEAGEAIFREFTREHVGESIALLVDGRVLNTPVIQSEIGPVFIVAGVAEEGLDEEFAKSLAGAF